MRQRSVIWALVIAMVVVCPVARGQVFYGEVLDGETRQPVWVAAVILVDFYNKVRVVGMTDSVGRYELVAPGPGRYRVRADARGYRHEYSGEYIVQASDTIEVNFLLIYDPEPPASVVARSDDLLQLEGNVREEVGWTEWTSRE